MSIAVLVAMATVLSSALQLSRASDHARFAAAAHAMVVAGHAVVVREEASAAELDATGRSD